MSRRDCMYIPDFVQVFSFFFDFFFQKLEKMKTSLLVAVFFNGLVSLGGGEMVSWYFNTQDFTRQCYCSMYSTTCSPNGCAEDGPCRTPYPRNYMAQHLNGAKIQIDGYINDTAWDSVPWSDVFTDIRGDHFPEPRYETKFKIRWDDRRLYVAVLMQAKDMWATYTEDESHLFKENAIEFFFAPDSTLRNYKEIQGNVRGNTWDLMMTKPYIDLGAARDEWEAREEKAVQHNGVINDPSQPGTFWTVEWAIPFGSLADFSIRTQDPPEDDEVFFVQFGRPDYKLKVVNGQYEQDTSVPATWFSWEPMGAINLHIPNRWGLVQFTRRPNAQFKFPRWHMYRTLFAIYEALLQFKALNGLYSSDLQELPVPRYVYRARCIKEPVITLTPNGFTVEVRSQILDERATIKHDRSIAFYRL